jgi:16S rRNA (guanine966-N2)-methyltransferase
MGLESLSKGAKWCMFVEQSPQSRAIIRQNIELLQVQGISKVYSRSAIDMGEMQSNSKGPFQLIFCDAPYYQDLSRQALDSAANGHWLANNAICVVETEKENRNMQLNENFFLLDTRQYADCLIYFVKYKIS